MSDMPTEDPQADAGNGGGATAGDGGGAGGGGGGGGGGAEQPGAGDQGGGGQPPATGEQGTGDPGTADPGTVGPEPVPGGQPTPGGPEPQHGSGDPQSGGDQGLVPNEPGTPGQGGLPGQHGQAVHPGAHDTRHQDDDGPDVEFVQVPHQPHHDPGVVHHGAGGDGASVSIEPSSVQFTAQRMRATSAELRHHATQVTPHTVLSPCPPEARAALEHRLSHLLATLHQLVEELEHEAADLETRAGQADGDGPHDAPVAPDQAAQNLASGAIGGGVAAAAGGLAGRRGTDDDSDATVETRRP
jgi:hypothetical protein